MTSHAEFADNAIEDEFPRVLEWVDYDVQCALLKAIYNSVKNKDKQDVVMFAKSLVQEIDAASFKYTETEYRESKSKVVGVSYINSSQAMIDAGHKPSDFL